MIENIKTNRNYGIDLLRLVLMFMICILHVLGQGGILESSLPGTMPYKVYWGLEILALCAVNSFAIISGYIANTKSRKYERIVDIWFQTFFYSFIVTVILTQFGLGDKLKVKELIACALPITSGKFWYITSYFALFCFMPIIDSFLLDVDNQKARRLFIVFILVYSCMGAISDPFKMNQGYSAIWLIILYCLGLLAKKIQLFEKKSTIFLIVLWIICALITWVLKVNYNIEQSISYLSPTILLNGLILVILFSRLKLNGKIVSKFAPLALGIYLLQCNQIIWDSVLKNAFIFILSKRLIVGGLYVLLFSTIIFLSGLIIEWIRQLLTKVIGLSKISNKLVKLGDFFLKKIFILLK